MTAGRLTGGFRHGEPSTTRGVSPAVAPDVAMAAARAERRLTEVRTARTFEAAGIARLVMGEPGRAIEALLNATGAQPDCASCWSNLSVAYLDRADQLASGAVAMLIPALDASERAVTLAPRLPEAWFNAALVRERVGLGAAAAWQVFVSLEGESPWGREGTARLQSLERPASATAAGPGASSTAWSLLPDRDVSASCAAHPGDARVYAEDLLLGQWAESVLSNDAREAGRLRGRLDVVGSCLEEFADDALLGATVARLPEHIDHPAAGRYAQLFRAYARGRAHYEGARETQAEQEFKRALLLSRNLGTPFRWLVEFQLAAIDYQARRLLRAQAVLDRTRARAETRKYRSLEVRATTLTGTVLMQRGRLRDSHEAYVAAAARADMTVDAELASTALYSLANTARLVGDSVRGWRALIRALPHLDRIGNPRRRLMVLYNASMLAEHDGRLFAALHFQNGALDTALARAVPGAIVEARTRRAELSYRLNRPADAAADLAAARTTLGLVAEPLRARYYSGLLNAVSGRTQLVSNPAGAVQYLTQALDVFGETEPADVPGLYLARGRAHRAGGQPLAAAADFTAGITALEALRARTTHRRDRVSLFDTGWELFAEMVALHSHDPAAAFVFAERGRARGLLDAMGGQTTEPSAAAIAAALPAGISILEYAVLERETLLWLVQRGRTRFYRLPVQSADLVDESRRYAETLRAGGAVESAGAVKLHGQLLAPAAANLEAGNALVVVGDQIITSIPFAALSPAPGRRLVEAFTISYAPSASVVLRTLALTASKANVEGLRLVAVGNPTFARDKYPHLRPLPGAEREVQEIGRHYAHATVLIGGQATKRRFLHELGTADVVHVGTHTVVNEEYPTDSELLFAGVEGRDDNLTVEELARSVARAPSIAVLAACSTSQGTPFRLEGVMSLARAFLELGTPQVVATQWDVDDASAATLFARLHRDLAAGIDAGVALRSAQLSLLRGADGRLRAPRFWAPYVVLGAAVTRADRDGADFTRRHRGESDD